MALPTECIGAGADAALELVQDAMELDARIHVVPGMVRVGLGQGGSA